MRTGVAQRIFENIRYQLGGNSIDGKLKLRQSTTLFLLRCTTTLISNIHILYISHYECTSKVQLSHAFQKVGLSKLCHLNLQSIVLIFFHILVPQEYWVQTKSRIPLKPVLGGVRIVALCISTHEQTQ